MKKNSVPIIPEFKTPKVYKNKKLNKANFGDFSHTDYQVFLHLVSKIGGVDRLGKYLQPEQLNREYVLTAQEFSKMFNANLSNTYKALRKSCKKLMKTSIIIEKPELSETWEINVCSMAKYNNKEGYISIKFTDDIMPYLAQVKKKFVLYNLKEIANFGSLYTTRLYELIQEFKETGWMIKSVEQLRDIFAVGNKFKAYRDFKLRTFAHACQEINDNYNMGLCFEEIKEGRKVVAVKFFFKQTIVQTVVNQNTGTTSTVYIKPKRKATKPKIKSAASEHTSQQGARKVSDILKDSPLFRNIKPIKNGFSSFISNILSYKKEK